MLRISDSLSCRHRHCGLPKTHQHPPEEAPEGQEHRHRQSHSKWVRHSHFSKTLLDANLSSVIMLRTVKANGKASSRPWPTLQKQTGTCAHMCALSPCSTEGQVVSPPRCRKPGGTISEQGDGWSECPWQLLSCGGTVVVRMSRAPTKDSEGGHG